MMILSFVGRIAHSAKLVTVAGFSSMLLFAIPAVFAANPTIEIKTNQGTIQVELYAEQAPKTVENFLGYVNEGYYDGTIFHRVIANFMIQGGGFDQNYTQKPTRDPVENEAANGLRNAIGTIAMARTNDPHSATSQFFINVANNNFLNYSAATAQGYGYTVFGKVIAGMEVVNDIAHVATGANGPFNRDVPQEMVIIENIKVLPAATSQNP